MKNLGKFMRGASLMLIAGFIIFGLNHGNAGPVEKVEICHFGDKELVLGDAALAVHQGHGDCKGPCPCDL